MVHSHHSHSGQFCGHAKDDLEEVIKRAIELKMETYCLTEHAPRYEEDLYDEEIREGYSVESLDRLFARYFTRAKLLQEKYASQIQILVGFEADYCSTKYSKLIKGLLEQYEFDMFVGSIHHVFGIPIDYSKQTYELALERAASIAETRPDQEGAEKRPSALQVLFENYFDEQLQMLEKLQPPVIGHFNLIVMMSGDTMAPLDKMPSCWLPQRYASSISRSGSLELLEISGHTESQPARIVLSDDSHGVAQVGENYSSVIDWLAQHWGLDISFLKIGDDGHRIDDSRFKGLTVKSMTLQDINQKGFGTLSRVGIQCGSTI